MHIVHAHIVFWHAGAGVHRARIAHIPCAYVEARAHERELQTIISPLVWLMCVRPHGAQCTRPGRPHPFRFAPDTETAHLNALHERDCALARAWGALVFCAPNISYLAIFVSIGS